VLKTNTLKVWHHVGSYCFLNKERREHTVAEHFVIVLFVKQMYFERGTRNLKKSFRD
jgi:hypothetical protein